MIPQYRAVAQHPPSCECCDANAPERVRSKPTDRMSAQRTARSWRGRYVNVRTVPEPETARLVLLTPHTQEVLSR